MSELDDEARIWARAYNRLLQEQGGHRGATLIQGTGYKVSRHKGKRDASRRPRCCRGDAQRRETHDDDASFAGDAGNGSGQ